MKRRTFPVSGAFFFFFGVVAAVAIALACLPNNVAAVSTKTIYTIDDTYISTQYPSTFYGTSQGVCLERSSYYCNCQFIVICQTCYAYDRIYAKFDVSFLETQCIQDVKLVMTLSSGKNPTVGTFTLSTTYGTWTGATLNGNTEASLAGVVATDNPQSLTASSLTNEGSNNWSWKIPATWIISACATRDCILSLGLSWDDNTNVQTKFDSLESDSTHSFRLVADYLTCDPNGYCNTYGTNIYCDTCACNTGFSLESNKYTCDNINDCSPNPCVHGKCVDGINSYTCDCSGTGYQGSTCQTEIDNCLSAPCQHGTCTNEVNDYTCSCDPGYEGKNCDQDIDECVGVTCMHGGTCENLIGKFFCECSALWTGTYCQNSTSGCTPGLCLNGGTCSSSGSYNYTCSCATGYTGQNCQTNIDDCVTNDCQHGTCVDGIASYTCDCTGSDYTGQYCQTKINNCAGQTCSGHGTCVDGFYTYTCTCIAGYTGDDCETNIDDCKGNPCGDHSTQCIDGVASFTCTCATGWTGPLCTIQVSCPSGESGNAYWPLSQASTTPVTGTCAQGYAAGASPPTRICQQSGDWEDVCNPCIQLTCPAQAMYPLLWPLTPALSAATVSCPAGYKSSNGAAVRLCDGTGNWGVIQYPCQELVCSPAIFADAEWQQTTNGYSATGACVDSYAGSPIANCVLNATSNTASWDEADISGSPCEMTADACPPDYACGYNYSRTAPGDTVTKPCPSGEVGSTTRQCQSGGNWGDVNTGGCHTLPPSVSLVEATSIGDTYMNIAWPDAEGATQYQVQISLDGNSFDICCNGNNAGKSVTSDIFEITGLTEFSDVIVEVLSGNRYGLESVGTFMRNRTNISPPRNLTVTAFNGTSVSVSWAPDAYAQWYYIFYGKTSDGTLQCANDGYKNPHTQLTIINLSPDTSYTVRVHCGRAVDAADQDYYEPKGSVVLAWTNTSGAASPPTSPATEPPGAEEVKHAEFLCDYEILIFVICFFAFFVVVYAFCHFRNSRGRNFVVITLGISLLDVAVHVAFVTMLPVGTLLFSASLAFVVVPCFLNFMAAVYILQSELHDNKEAITHLQQHSTVPVLSVVLSFCNAEVISIISSGMLNGESFLFNFSLAGQKKWVILGCISNVFEDIPQLAIICHLLLTHDYGISDCNNIYLVLAVTALSLVYGIGRHVYFAYLWKTNAGRYGNLYPPSASVSAYGSANYLMENTMFLENTLILSEPTRIFGSQRDIVFSEPTQIWTMTSSSEDRPDLPFVYIIYPDQTTTVEACVAQKPLVLGGVDEGANTVGFQNPLIMPTHCEIRWSQAVPQQFSLVSYGQTVETATLINGRIAPPSTPVQLAPSDVVQFGTPTGPSGNVTPIAFIVKFITVMKPQYRSACMAIQLAPGSVPFTRNLITASSALTNSDTFNRPLSQGSFSGMASSSPYISSAVPGRPPLQRPEHGAPPPSFSVGGPVSSALAPAVVVLRAHNFPGGCSVVDISKSSLHIGGGGNGYDATPNFLRLGVPGISPVQVQIYATYVGEKLSFRATDPGSVHGTVVDGQPLSRPQTDTLYFERDASVALSSSSTIVLTDTLTIQVGQIMPMGEEPFVELYFPDASVMDLNGCKVIRNQH